MKAVINVRKDMNGILPKEITIKEKAHVHAPSLCIPTDYSYDWKPDPMM